MNNKNAESGSYETKDKYNTFYKRYKELLKFKAEKLKKDSYNEN